MGGSGTLWRCMQYRHCLGWLETILSFLFWKIAYWYVAGPTRVTVHTWLSEFFCNSAIMGSVIFNSATIYQGVRLDPLGELTVLPGSSRWIWGSDLCTGKEHKGKGGKGERGGGEGKRTRFLTGTSSFPLPALLLSSGYMLIIMTHDNVPKTGPRFNDNLAFMNHLYYICRLSAPVKSVIGRGSLLLMSACARWRNPRQMRPDAVRQLPSIQSTVSRFV